MNLYRSFGNLLEAWMTEGGQCSDSAWPGNNDEDPRSPSSDVGTNPRSESVDSGVETASSVMSFPATPSSVSTDNADIDLFTPGRLLPASTSQSPVFSSSSSCSPLLGPGRAQTVGSTALNLKVAQALQKTDSVRLKKNRRSLIVDEMLSRSSSLHKREPSESVRGQRSQRKMSEICRRPMSTSCDEQPVHTRSEDAGEKERTRLSPGLHYLEHVCQMLEEIARQRMQDRASQTETDGPRVHRDAEILHTSQSHSEAEEDLSPRQSRRYTESAGHREHSHRHRPFRQRSASDTNMSTLQSRRFNADCRGQHQSTNDLLEMEEEDHEKQGSEKEEAKKPNWNWKMKFGSVVRNEKGQQMQSFEKKSTWRRLSQLIKRRKT